MAEIAATKAGIIKEGGFVVLAQQQPEAAVELLKKAAEVGADIAREGLEYEIESRALAVGGQLLTIRTPKDRYEDIFLPLHGKHQASNAAAALVAVEAFFGDQELDYEAVLAGFANVQSPGRCEVLHRDPTIIIDAAHNPHGARAITDTIQSEFTFDEVLGVFAAMGDKDVEGALVELEKVMNTVIITKNSSDRSMSVEKLEAIASRIFGADRTFSADTLDAAIEKAIKDANRPLSEDTLGILITGSVVTVGEARAIVRKRYAKEGA
jgi:dihydrofolate synthase/folylpolyglutamate synthase